VALWVLVLPAFLVTAALWLRPLWIKLAVIAVAAPIGLLCLLAALFVLLEIRYGPLTSFRNVSQVELLGSVVRAYETNGGATTNFGLIVRQEKLLLPGILLVRDLCQEYPAMGGSVQQVGPETVRVNAYAEKVDQCDLPIRIRRYVWF